MFAFCFMLTCANFFCGIIHRRHDDHTGIDVHGEIYYSTNWYTERAQSIVVDHNTNATKKDTPLWIHLMYQGVHSPYVNPPPWEGIDAPQFWDQTFADMLHVVDTGIGNLTSTLKAQDMWEDTLLIITADNVRLSNRILPLSFFLVTTGTVLFLLFFSPIF